MAFYQSFVRPEPGVLRLALGYCAWPGVMSCLWLRSMALATAHTPLLKSSMLSFISALFPFLHWQYRSALSFRCFRTVIIETVRPPVFGLWLFYWSLSSHVLLLASCNLEQASMKWLGLLPLDGITCFESLSLADIWCSTCRCKQYRILLFYTISHWRSAI